MHHVLGIRPAKEALLGLLLLLEPLGRVRRVVVDLASALGRDGAFGHLEHRRGPALGQRHLPQLRSGGDGSVIVILDVFPLDPREEVSRVLDLVRLREHLAQGRNGRGHASASDMKARVARQIIS